MARVAAVLVTAFAVVAFAAFPATSASSVDETHLPLGKTVTQPTRGALWTCQTSFGQGGASGQGPWFNGDGTWNAQAKPVVDGDVSWPDAKLTITKQGNQRVITTTDLPTDHTTGVFPVAASDDAHQYDPNPNRISAQSVTLEVPLNPKRATSPSCVGGEVGILKSGVVLFDAVDAGGRDAVAYEVQDHCDGHPQNAGEYHYHSVSSCVLAKLDGGTGQSKLVGWAFDGFGIYGPRNAKGRELTNADLDECHGTTSKVVFNGRRQRIYHYVATTEFPYTVGCFRGTSTVQGPTAGGGVRRGAGPLGGGPPPGAGPPGAPGAGPPPR